MNLTKKKKNLFLSIGSIVLTSAIFVPIILIKCASKDKEEKETINKETNNVEEKETINNKEINSFIVQNSNITNGRYSNFIEDDFNNFWSMGHGTKLQVLKFNKNKNNYVNSWTDDNEENGEKLLNGSKIINGEEGTIFKDSFGNLWAMAKNRKLQVLPKKENDSYADSWISDSNEVGLLKDSNINNGSYGTIFQDKFKNLWAMGNGTKLQVLKVNSDGTGYVNAWVDNNAKNSGDELLKNSNIEVAGGGKIFQDKFGNLWAMGNNKLQVLKVNLDGTGYVNAWADNNDKSSGDKLLKNSNIDDGESGIIFQDKFGNLWICGYDTHLQVLKVNSDGTSYVNAWVNNNDKFEGDELLKNSKLNDGYRGKIFQDSFGNLWAMGNDTKLQVLKYDSKSTTNYVSEGWTSDNSERGENLLKGSNIILDKRNSNDGEAGQIFQDKSGNLWSMGSDTPLQVLKVNSSKNGYLNEGWTDDTSKGLLKNSNIIEGFAGTLFQDSFGSLWSIGYETKLQVFDKNLKKWVS